MIPVAVTAAAQPTTEQDRIELEEAERLLGVANEGLEANDPRVKVNIPPGDKRFTVQADRCILLNHTATQGGLFTDATLVYGGVEQVLTQGSVVFLNGSAHVISGFTELLAFGPENEAGDRELTRNVQAITYDCKPFSGTRRTQKTDYNLRRLVSARDITAFMFTGNNEGNAENSLPSFMKTDKYKKDLFPGTADPQALMEAYRYSAVNDLSKHKEIFLKVNQDVLVDRLVTSVFTGRANANSNAAKCMIQTLKSVVRDYYEYEVRGAAVPDGKDNGEIKGRMDLVPIPLAVTLGIMEGYEAVPPSAQAVAMQIRQRALQARKAAAAAAPTVATSTVTSTIKRVKAVAPDNWEELSVKMGYPRGTEYFKDAEKRTKSGELRQRPGRAVGSKVQGGKVLVACGSRPIANKARRVSDVSDLDMMAAESALKAADVEEIEKLTEDNGKLAKENERLKSELAALKDTHNSFVEVAMNKDAINRERFDGNVAMAETYYAIATSSGMAFPMMLTEHESPLKKRKLTGTGGLKTGENTD